MFRTARLLTAAAIVFAPAMLQAQAASPLPPAKELIARYVTAIGGRDALLKHTTVRSTGSFEMAAAGLKGELTMVQSKDGKQAMTISIPGMGELAGGYDGTIGWSMNPMQGPRILEGKELAQLQEEAGFLTMLRESPGLKSAETVEQTTLGGEACYKVKLTYASGRVSYDCYSIATGLLVGTVAVQESNMGQMELTTAMSDWKEFGGVKMPTKMRQSAMGQEQVMTITSVEFDGADHARAFELPAAVKAIAAQKKP